MLKKWLPVAAKLAVSGFLIWYLLGKVDLAAAGDRLLRVAPGMLALAIAIIVVQTLLATLRWEAVLKAIGSALTFLAALRLFFIGAFFSQTLPSSVGGDGVRMYLAYRAGLPLGAAINGVMLERVATLIALVAVAIATLPFLLARVGADVGGWLVPLALAFAGAAVLGIALLSLLDRLPESLRRWRVVRGLAVLAGDTRKVFLAPRHTAVVLAWSALSHFNVTLALFALALGLGLDVTLIDCLALFPPVLLVTTLPISIAGWGVREGAMVAAFGLIGVAPEGALVLSLLFGLVAMAVSLPGGVVWLMSGERRRGAVRAGVAAVATGGKERAA